MKNKPHAKNIANIWNMWKFETRTQQHFYQYTDQIYIIDATTNDQIYIIDA